MVSCDMTIAVEGNAVSLARTTHCAEVSYLGHLIQAEADDVLALLYRDNHANRTQP